MKSDNRKASLIKKHERLPKSAGRTQILRFQRGKKLTAKQSILLMCSDCDGDDCFAPSCMLFRRLLYKCEDFEMEEELIEYLSQLRLFIRFLKSVWEYPKRND